MYNASHARMKIVLIPCFVRIASMILERVNIAREPPFRWPLIARYTPVAAKKTPKSSGRKPADV